MISYSKCDLNIEKDVLELKSLWLNSFEDNTTALDIFFDKNRDKMSVYSARNEKEIISALYLIDCTLNGEKAHYLCGASTDKSYRGRGIMSALIEFALECSSKSGDKYSILFPASESLYSFYSAFGYQEKCSALISEISRDKLEKIVLKQNFDNIQADDFGQLNNYENLQMQAFEKNFLLYDADFIDFTKEYYNAYEVKIIDADNCFALFEESKDCADVFYSMCLDFSFLAKELLKKSKAKKFKFVNKADVMKKDSLTSQLFDENKVIKYGMIKSLNNNLELFDDVFIGITLN